MTTHPKCGKEWSGNRTEHCPACCQTFAGRTAGDKHRVGDWDNPNDPRRCLSPDRMRALGMVLNAYGYWSTGEGYEQPYVRTDA